MDFTKLQSYLDTLCARYGVPAWDCAVRKDHKDVFRHAGGHSDIAGTTPVKRGDLYWLYSTSKLITCTAALRLVEAGVLSLEDEVSKYLPEYAHLTVQDGDTVRPAKTVMRIRHLLTMSSGLTYDISTPAVDALRHTGKGGTVSYMRALAEKPLAFDPGEGFCYSLSHDVLGAVEEVASGISFGTLLRREIFDPLELHDTGFAPSPEQADRFSTLWVRQNDSDRLVPKHGGPRESWAYESGGGGLFGSVDDYIRFADALAHDGLADNGYRLLHKETVEMMRTNSLNAHQDAMFHHQMNQRNKDGYGYGLGVKTLTDKTMSPGPLGEFGWDGAAGAYVLCDPVNHLSVFYAQHILNFPVVYNEIMVRIRDLVYQGL